MKRALIALTPVMLFLGTTLWAQTQTPYGGTNATISNGSTIQAENYDVGGEGVAYHDTTAGNTGGQYRSDDVDVEATGDAGGGYNVGWVVDGEWLEYTVNATAGTYDITARVASAGSAVGDLQVLLDGVVLGTIPVNATGGWQTYVDATLAGVSVPGGNNKVLRLQSVNGGDFNINYVRFATTSSGSNLAQSKPVTASSTLSPYVATNANDGNLTTYWESTGSFPASLAVSLGANFNITSVVVKLNPDPVWATRTQTIQVLGHTLGGTTFTNLVGAATYTFNPSTGSSVTIPVTATVSDVELTVTSNSGAPGAQVAELQVIGSGGTVPTPTGTSTPTATATSTPTPTARTTPTAPSTPTATATATATTRSTPTATATATTRATPTATSTPTPTATTATPTPTTGPSSNLAVGKAIAASSVTQTFVATNANDDSVTTYWEGSAYPATLTVSLGANANITSVVVKLNPDPVWATRTQTIQVMGHNQTSTTFTNLVSAATYTFNPASGANTVTIPVTATVSDVQLVFTANSGAPGGQCAELQVLGTMAPNPDLTISGMSWSPNAPDEVTAIAISATVQNIGSAAAGATTVSFNLAGSVVGSANVSALAAGASTTVSFNAGTKTMGTYSVSGTVDPTNTIIETNDANNTFTSASSLVVAQAPGPDLQVTGISTNPQSPAVGAAVTFTVSVNNRGTSGVAAGSTTRVVVGTTTLNNTNTPSIAAGATVPVSLGTWTATAGGATVTATADATGTVAETNESNNSLSKAIVVGRGAASPYIELEAEDAAYQGTLLVADAVRTYAHTNFATESSGRRSVRLDATGNYVEFTSTASANSIVVRNCIPDAAGGGGIDATISLYVNGAFLQKIPVSSHNSWLYGSGDGPSDLTNTPQADARRLFDESHALLATSYPAGTRFKLQRDSTDTAPYYIIDFIDLEQVPLALPMPAGFTSITAYGAVPNDGIDDTAAIQAALMDNEAGKIAGVWIPPGQWRQEQKFLTPDPTRTGYNQVGLSNVKVQGAGMWYSVLYTTTDPNLVTGNINHPHEGNSGFDIDNNVQISDLAIFGAGTIRDYGGVGLNGRFGKNTKITNVWIEHVAVGAWVGRDYDNIPALWGPADGLQLSGMRIRNTFADGINFTNGTRNSTVFNSSIRYTGDDGLAVWANQYVKDTSVDIAHDNHFINDTVQLPWRANGAAIYGGYGNSIENCLIYDTMNYPGIMLATDHSPLPFSGTTLIANNGLYRDGGIFWGAVQKFGAITLFPSTIDIVGAVIRDTDIADSTYDGIQFKNGGGNMANVTVTNTKIDKSNNGAGILAMAGARGNATLSNVPITSSSSGNVVIEPGSTFTITGN
jgi:CARDB/Carbohydrate binding module (family 6)/F5/8 type C domain